MASIVKPTKLIIFVSIIKTCCLMQKIIGIIIILFLLLPSTIISQNSTDKDFITGEVLVQLTSDADLEIIKHNYNLEHKELISQRFNIYLLSFDKNKTTNSAIIELLDADKSILNVQNNHMVSLRDNKETLPNDSLFDKQWSFMNTGQNNGVVGADIDAIMAWDLSTGGLTVLGDTIVVAIVDGGSDLNHEDLNFWKNHAEIPNNSIDDDNNGYVDDYDGWNAYNNSGSIPLSNHGVHVCGIAGAIGNNNIGVAGVNWNVKTLPIAGESSYESIVVKALSYIYVVREQYDQTNGTEGAFVVAQNNSFGVDNAQPANYPIWQAMYDSLGQLGILSMGATANKAWDIDVVGDVPTAFTTEYMISVTNTTNQDKLYPAAGWGLTTIDLGAPGTSVMSLGINSTYRTSTGTSMATPHVTGGAALLMAFADSSFIASYKNNPSLGAIFIKDFLLNGVDPLSDLENKTVTGGRLNIYNSLQLMNDRQEYTTNIDSIFNEISINQIENDTLIITNTSFESIVYDLLISNQPQWISLSTYQGQIPTQNSDTIIITFDSHDIDTGSHLSNILIETVGIESKNIPVEIYVYDPTSISEVKQISSVEAYPNPTKSDVVFDFSLGQSGELYCQIFDQHGSLVFSERRVAGIGDYQIIWNSGLNTSGIYYYRVTLNNQQLSSGKVVKL